MKKKSPYAKVKQAAVPQSAQLDAVRKLSHAGRHQEVQARVAGMLARFPDFKPLLGLAWEVADRADNLLSATLYAWDWSAASPASLIALEALQDSAFAAGYPALGALATNKLAQAAGKPLPDLPPLQGALGEFTFDQAVATDLAHLFLTAGRFSETVALLENIDHPVARNNLALARFARGEVAAALEAVEANFRQDIRNLFALHLVARLRLWAGGRGSASELTDALRAVEPLRAEDVYGKMFGLLLLGAYDDTIDAWHTLREAEFWKEEDAFRRSACAHFAGVAALRAGDAELARKQFSDAIFFHPKNLDAETAFIALTLGALGKEVDLKAGEFRDWFPQSWIAEFQAAKEARVKDALLEAQQRRCDAHADYLAAACELGGEAVRFYALSILKSRALDGDTVARDTLRTLLTRPCGPDEVRLKLDLWLEEHGLVEPGRPRQLLMRGEVRELELRPMRLHAEPTDLGLPPASQARLEEVHRLMAKADLHEALRVAEELVAAHPGIPTLVGNIASIKDALGYDLDEIEALFRRAAELDPSYLFAQAGLARVAARKGDAERARELLRPLHGREEYHFSEWRAILHAERAIALAESDLVSVRKADEALEMLNEQFG